MLSKKIMISAMSGLFVLLTASSYAAPMASDSHDVVAREATEGPRGGDNERPGDRQHRGGRLSNNQGTDILARRGADDPPGTERPGDNHRQRRGGRVMTEDVGQFILAREATEAPRGADNNNQRRRGRG